MRLYKKKGFTLLELMIVVIIIGILASLAVPRFIEATRKAKEAEARAILGSIRSAQMRYYLENEERYRVDTDIDDLDLSIAPGGYFDYGAADAADGSGYLGRAVPNTRGPNLRTFNIDEKGTITIE